MKMLLASWMVLFAAAGFACAATLDVDKGKSRIQVDAKATGHSFSGTLEDYTASVTGDAASLSPRGFDLSWSFKDLKTADKKRDDKMLEWLGGGNPRGNFKFEKSWKKNGRLFAQGKLTIKGVSKTISFPYTVKKDGDWVTIDGEVWIDHKDFGLPIIRAVALMTVDPKLKIRFHIVGEMK